MTSQPVRVLIELPLGSRVVVRYRIEGGFTDALGYLRARDDSVFTVETRRGLTEVPVAAVVLAKEVPPPSARR